LKLAKAIHTHIVHINYERTFGRIVGCTFVPGPLYVYAVMNFEMEFAAATATAAAAV